MSTKIVKTDRSQEPEVIKVITPEPVVVPEPVPETVDVIEFAKLGDTITGMFTESDDKHHFFVANGRRFAVENNSDNATINEALKIIPGSTLVKIEYLGFDEHENRGLFEVSTID